MLLWIYASGSFLLLEGTQESSYWSTISTTWNHHTACKTRSRSILYECEKQNGDTILPLMQIVIISQSGWIWWKWQGMLWWPENNRKKSKHTKDEEKDIQVMFNWNETSNKSTPILEWWLACRPEALAVWTLNLRMKAWKPLSDAFIHNQIKTNFKIKNNITVENLRKMSKNHNLFC